MTGNQITAVYSPKTKQLKVFKDGKPIGGFRGNIALSMYRRIVFNNTKARIQNGNI